MDPRNNQTPSKGTLMMNNLNTILIRAEHALAQRSNRANEEGSQTTDNLLWAIGVIAIAGLAVLALTTYAEGLVGRLG